MNTPDLTFGLEFSNAAVARADLITRSAATTNAAIEVVLELLAETLLQIADMLANDDYGSTFEVAVNRRTDLYLVLVALGYPYSMTQAVTAAGAL